MPAADPVPGGHAAPCACRSAAVGFRGLAACASGHLHGLAARDGAAQPAAAAIEAEPCHRGFLAQAAPRGIDQKRLERCLEAVQAPCSRREENLLRTVFEAEYTGREAKARAVIEKVEEMGLEPFRAPDPLPPIRAEDVHLVCWLAIECVRDSSGLPIYSNGSKG